MDLGPSIKFIEENKHLGLSELALSLGKKPELDKLFILNQINGIQKAEKKLPEFHATPGIWYPTKLSMEQCSSEETATFKSKIVSGSTLLDLTGGFGIDSYYFAQEFHSVTYVEEQKELADLATHNFNLLKPNNIKIVHSEAGSFLSSHEEKVDLIYIDPSRRDENNRVFRLEDCRPNLAELNEDMFRLSNAILIKTAPFLDIKQALNELPFVAEVFVVAVNNECKEVLYLLKKGWSQEVQIHAINLGKSQQEVSFTYAQERSAVVDYSKALSYLYEPNSALLKAGAFNFTSQHFRASKLNPNSHLYTSENRVADFPGRAFKILHILPYQTEKFKELGIEKANVSCRNFRDNVDGVKQKLGIKDGGEHFVFATTGMEGNPVILVCVK